MVSPQNGDIWGGAARSPSDAIVGSQRLSDTVTGSDISAVYFVHLEKFYQWILGIFIKLMSIHSIQVD